MNEVKTPKKPLIYYYVIVLLVLSYCVFIIVHRRREARLAARMGAIMGCAGCRSRSCGSCHPAVQKKAMPK